MLSHVINIKFSLLVHLWIMSVTTFSFLSTTRPLELYTEVGWGEDVRQTNYSQSNSIISGITNPDYLFTAVRMSTHRSTKTTWTGGSPATLMSHWVTHGGFILAAALLVGVRLRGALLLCASALLLSMPSAQHSYAPVQVYNPSLMAFKFIHPPTLSGLSSAGRSHRGCWIASLCPCGLFSLKHINWSWHKQDTEVNSSFQTEEGYIILTSYTIRDRESNNWIWFNTAFKHACWTLKGRTISIFIKTFIGSGDVSTNWHAATMPT